LTAIKASEAAPAEGWLLSAGAAPLFGACVSQGRKRLPSRGASLHDFTVRHETAGAI